MDTALNVLSWVLLFSGSFFAVAGGIGIIRLPDFYTRVHASGITDTGAAYLILAGLMIQGGLTLITVKLALIGFFMFFSNPTATYALTTAAHRAGIEPLLGSGDTNMPDPNKKTSLDSVEPAQPNPGSTPPSQP